ncbi:dihydrolipoyl dehydrogenase, partial [Candidatus Uhrbacteria bacterium CG_4_9_14_3_um_filter_36_7]
FIKMIIQTKTRTILGAHLIGPRAGDIIHEIALAIHLQIKVDVLDEMIHAFPTYAEAITEAASRF